MVETRDVLSVFLTGIVLASVLAGEFSLVSVVLASTLVLLSIINLVPCISDEQQRYTVTGLAIFVMFGMFVRFSGDPVVVSLVVGAVIGLTLLAVKGPKFRWPAMGIFTFGVLMSIGISVQSGRLQTATILILIGVAGLITAKHYWSTS